MKLVQPNVSSSDEHHVWQSSNTACRSSSRWLEKRKKNNFSEGWYFFCLLCVKENISPGLDILRKPSVTRLAAGFHLFTAGICQAKLANYGFHWTKLSLFLVLIGWDDLIRLLYKSSYLRNSPVSKLGGIFLGVSNRHFSCGTNWLPCVNIRWLRQTPQTCKQGNMTLNWWVPQGNTVETWTP